MRFFLPSPYPIRILILRGIIMAVTETDQMVGKLGNNVGEIVEHFAAPDIREQFNDLNSGLSEFLSRWQISLDHNPFFFQSQ
jgi:hypothetical protein